MMTTPIVERFLCLVDTTNSDCWIWKGTKNHHNYGRFNGMGEGKEWLAHRASWKLFNGDFDLDLLVCHICDNPICVRPSHLYLGTSIQNTHDAIRKGRFKGGKKGSNNGAAKLDEEKVKLIRSIYSKGELSAKKIGNMFGVSGGNISDIVRFNSWKHVKEESIND